MLCSRIRYPQMRQRYEPVSASYFASDFTFVSNSLLKVRLFIVRKAFERQAVSMRRSFGILSFGFIVSGAFAMPSAASAREAEPAESASCNDPKHRHVVVRPLTESLPIRKADKIRIRRILM